jgi:hypothetical protein
MANMRLRTIASAVGGIVLVVLCGSGAATTRLEWKLAKGKTYYQRTVMDQQIAQTVMGQEQKIEQATGLGLKLQVLDVDAQGNMRIQYTYLWTKLKQVNPMAQVDYDSSRQSPVPAGAESFAALVGQSYTIKMTPKGKVLDVNGVEQLKEAVLKKLPAGAETGPMASTIAAYTDKDNLKQMTEARMAIFPDKPVSPGDSWNKDMTVAIGFPVIIQSKWTLQKEEAGVATITLTSTLRPDPSAPPMDTGGMKLNCNLSGTQEGTLQVAEVTGLLTASKARQQLKGDVKVAASAGAPPAMAIPMTIDTQITGEMSDQMWKTGPQ